MNAMNSNLLVGSDVVGGQLSMAFKIVTETWQVFFLIFWILPIAFNIADSGGFYIEFNTDIRVKLSWELVVAIIV